jgi:ABC-type branched-subunit amino acid transport system substrate-binding protein
MKFYIQFSFLLTFTLLDALHASAEHSTIGTLAELSGPYARLGEDCRRGYEVAKKSASSSTLIAFGDNQSDPKVGLTEYRRMVNSEKASIVVTTRSPVALALNPISFQQRIPLIGVVGQPRFTSDNPYAVRVYPSAANEAKGLAIAAAKEVSIATINLEDEYFLGLKASFEEQVGQHKIIFSEVVAPTNQEFSSILYRIKSKSPTAIFINVAPSQIGLVLRAMSNIGLKAKIYSNFLIGAADIRTSLGSLAEGVVFVELNYQQPAFLKALYEMNGSTDTSPIGYGCYIGLTYALQLLEQSKKEGVSLTDLLSTKVDIQTLDGAISIKDREAKFQLVTKVIKQGEVLEQLSM